MIRFQFGSARAISASLTGLLLAASSPVFAQNSNGVRTGRFRVHPEARVEGRFDNNLYREDADEGLTQAGYVRLMPSLRITNPFPGSVAIDGSGGLEIRQYLDSTINDQQDAIGLNLAAGATLGRGKAFSLSLNEDLRRQLEPGQGFSTDVQGADDGGATTSVLENGCATPCTLSFWQNTTRVLARFAPGGGRFVFAPSYRLRLTRFEETDNIDKDTHELRAGASYRFFPRTSLVFDASYEIIDYLEPQGSGSVADITPIKVRAGLRGLITTKLAATLTGGFGTTNAASGDDYSNFLAQAELIYALTQGMRARLQYARDVSDSSFSNFVQTDRIGVRVQARLGGNFNANADFAVSIRNYSQGFLTGVNAGTDEEIAASTVQIADAELNERSDTFYIANLAGSYHPNDWLVITGGYRLEQNDTSFGVRVNGVENFSAFQRHQIFLGAGLLL